MVVDTFALIVGVQAAAAVVSADEAFVFALLAVRVVIVCDGATRTQMRGRGQARARMSLMIRAAHLLHA